MRVIAPDLVGYGKSDKPAALEDYSYERQVEWLGAWLEANDFTNITFFGQDWGGLVGLRLVVNHATRGEQTGNRSLSGNSRPSVCVGAVVYRGSSMRIQRTGCGERRAGGGIARTATFNTDFLEHFSHVAPSLYAPGVLC